MKTQMKFQKIMCLVMLLMGALSAVYCFIYCSGGIANIGMTIEKRDGQPVFKQGFEEAGQLFLDAQSFNNVLLVLSIVMIVAAAFLYITATNKRRNYYVTNYVAIGLTTVVDVVVSLYVLIQNSIFMGRFNAIIADPAMNQKYQELAEEAEAVEYVTSTWNFVFGYFVYVLVIAACVLLVLNLVWKIKLMQGEKALLNGGTVKEVA